MFNEFEEGTPMAEDMNTPNRTPFPSNTPNVYIKANNVSFIHMVIILISLL